MKNKLSVLLASAVLTSSIACASAFAFGPYNDNDLNGDRGSVMHKEKGERFMQHKFKKMAKYLDLTQEQRANAKDIYQQAKISRGELKEGMESFRQQTKELMMADSFDEQAFLDLHNQHRDDFAQIALIKVKTKHSFINMLTEEQKDKMKSMKARHEKGRKFSE